MPRILFPDEAKIEECLKTGVMAIFKAMGHLTVADDKCRCPICGTANCTEIYQSVRGYDSLLNRERKVVVGCDKCLETTTPFDLYCGLALDALNIGRDEYERNHQPKPELPRETGKVIDSLALGRNPELSNF